jgi:hypothetical protein
MNAYCERFQFSGSGSAIEPNWCAYWPLTNSRPVRLNATTYMATPRAGTVPRWKRSLNQASTFGAPLRWPDHILASGTVCQAHSAPGSVSDSPASWQNRASRMVIAGASSSTASAVTEVPACASALRRRQPAATPDRAREQQRPRPGANAHSNPMRPASNTASVRECTASLR